jgi:hypothetical protein
MKPAFGKAGFIFSLQITLKESSIAFSLSLSLVLMHATYFICSSNNKAFSRSNQMGDETFTWQTKIMVAIRS